MQVKLTIHCLISTLPGQTTMKFETMVSAQGILGIFARKSIGGLFLRVNNK